jgi:hypothetical protein
MKFLPATIARRAFNIGPSPAIASTVVGLKTVPELEGEQSTKKKKKSKGLVQKLQESGFNQDDIPKAIIFHEFLGIFMLALTWSLCYFFPPSQNQFLQKPIAKMKELVPQKLSNAWSSNGFLNSKMGAAYVESSCLRKIIRPVTLPSKVFLTIQFLKMTRKTSPTSIPLFSSVSSNVIDCNSSGGRFQSQDSRTEDDDT